MRQIIGYSVISGHKIRQYAREAGFSLCGIAPARPMNEHGKLLASWLAEGYDSGLDYMRRNAEKRSDPALLFEGAKTVVVCAVNYKNAAWDQSVSAAPRIASYAVAADYHVTIKRMLLEILGRLAADYPGLRGRCFTDTAPIFEKAWAAEAGLGWRGKNSLLLTPGFGSFVFLGEILLDREADTCDEPLTKDGCGTCTACIDSCPNGAIRRPGVIDASRCISRLTVEGNVEGSAEGICEKPDTHGWLFGCDICQSVCPYNQRTPLFSNDDFTPLFDPEESGPEFWLNLTHEDFDRKFGDTPMSRAGFERIKQLAVEFYEKEWRHSTSPLS